MEKGRTLRNSQIIILGICIAAATIISSVILSQGFLTVTRFVKEQITVTGAAKKEIKSDLVVWTASFQRVEPDLQAVYGRLEDDLKRVTKYLNDKGLDTKEITASQISMDKIYKKNPGGEYSNEIEGYRLSQSIEVRSGDVEKITQISRESTELINEGIEFVSFPPNYYYTRLDELKVEMLARATENAKERAENMVKATGNKIGFMRSAKMGVFQITPVNSTEVSDYGVSDTSSLDKKVTAVVTVSFSIK